MKDKERRTRKRFAYELEHALQARDEARFLEALKKLGAKEGSSEWDRALEHFRSLKSYL